MRYRDDPILQQKAAEQSTTQVQPVAKHRRVMPDVPWYTRQTGGSACGAHWVLWLVMLGFILGIVGYLLLNR
jgi:hypothetical protein